MIRSFTAAAALGVVLLAIAACVPPATKPSFPDIRFTDQPKLRLDVAAIEVVDDYHPTFQAPNVDHLFPVPPQRAAENWAHDRLEATGTTRRARHRRWTYTICPSSVTSRSATNTSNWPASGARSGAAAAFGTCSFNMSKLDCGWTARLTACG